MGRGTNGTSAASGPARNHLAGDDRDDFNTQERARYAEGRCPFCGARPQDLCVVADSAVTPGRFELDESGDAQRDVVCTACEAQYREEFVPGGDSANRRLVEIIKRP
jgi:hypothetical protein